MKPVFLLLLLSACCDSDIRNEGTHVDDNLMAAAQPQAPRLYAPCPITPWALPRHSTEHKA
jgi:hypothetical protein